MTTDVEMNSVKQMKKMSNQPVANMARIARIDERNIARMPNKKFLLVFTRKSVTLVKYDIVICSVGNIRLEHPLFHPPTYLILKYDSSYRRTWYFRVELLISM